MSGGVARFLAVLFTGCMLVMPTVRGQPALTLVDDEGRVIGFERAPKRIVSLAPHATEMLFAIGLGPSVVAVDRNSDHPGAASLTRLEAWPQPSVEAVLALRPDLVVAWKPGTSARFLESMSRFAVPVFVSGPATLGAVADSMERLAALSPEPASGRELAEGFRRRLHDLKTGASGRAPVRVLVQIWQEPLIVAGDADLIGDAIRACGAINVAADWPGAAPMIGFEQAIAARPDLIVALDHAGSHRKWEQAGVLPPRGRARFVHLDGSLLMRPGPRAIDAAQALCDAIGTGSRSRSTAALR